MHTVHTIDMLYSLTAYYCYSHENCLSCLPPHRPLPPDKLAELIDEASENNLTVAVLTQVSQFQAKMWTN